MNQFVLGRFVVEQLAGQVCKRLPEFFRQPVAEAPASEPPPPADLEWAQSGAADVSVAGGVIALPAERWSIDPWRRTIPRSTLSRVDRVR